MTSTFFYIYILLIIIKIFLSYIKLINIKSLLFEIKIDIKVILNNFIYDY